MPWKSEFLERFFLKDHLRRNTTQLLLKLRFVIVFVLNCSQQLSQFQRCWVFNNKQNSVFFCFSIKFDFYKVFEKWSETESIPIVPRSLQFISAVDFHSDQEFQEHSKQRELKGKYLFSTLFHSMSLKNFKTTFLIFSFR